MRFVISCITILLFVSYSAHAQQYRPANSADIYNGLERLNVLGTVMYLAAHPDDENTRLISYLVHHDHVRTVYLSLTRGDGGQNILGTEQGSALGLIRTYELIEARKIDGAEQVFTSALDFGFSKSPEETFHFWDKADLARQVARAFQKYRPDVVICRFPTTGEGGHGQHTASAIIAQEAYALQKSAPSPNSKEKPWLPTRLLFNAFRFGDRSTIKEDQFKVPINQYDPLLGEGYGEMAGRSRSIHKSQGAGTPQVVGIEDERFAVMEGLPMTKSLYDNVDVSWARVGRQDIGDKIRRVIKDFEFTRPALSVPALLEIRKEIVTVADPFWRAQKLNEIDGLILSCAGFMGEAVCDMPEAVPGSVVPLQLKLIARAEGTVQVQAIDFHGATGEGRPAALVNLENDKAETLPFTLRLADSLRPTSPYWLENEALPGAYRYDQARFKGLPEAPNALYCSVTLRLQGQDIEVKIPISYKKLDPVKGDVVQPLRIVPRFSLFPLQPLTVYEPGKPAKVGLRIVAYSDAPSLTLKARYGKASVWELPLGKMTKGQDTLLSLSIPTLGWAHAGGDNLDFFLSDGSGTYDKGVHVIQYPHLPDLQYLRPARLRAIARNWETRAKKVGYVAGAGDNVAAILGQCGLEVDMLTSLQFENPSSLDAYDAILIGVRAFNVEKRLNAWMPQLLQYAERGGTLIVQYNTNQNLVAGPLGPYPFDVSRDRVTEEDALVTIDTKSVLMSRPNTITSADFDDWVQERGIYFPTKWDARYKTPLSLHDTGEADLKSAILYAPYGKGNYIYTSLVFFRQLPAGNVGSIRLLMNLLSVGK